MFLTLNEVSTLINSGKLLHIAADDVLLKKLPKGNWIGGTTPYFITESGGVCTKDKLFVTEIAGAESFSIKCYDENNILSIGADFPENGYSLLILPFGSRTLVKFSKDADTIENVFLSNLIGWVSGFDLSDADASAKVYNGQTLECSGESGIVLHVSMPAEKLFTMAIINIFAQDTTQPAISFETSGFSVEYCLVNGERVHFAEYIEKNQINTQLPLVADYMGTNINISIKEISNGIVQLYAPVFSDTAYYFAKPVADYAVQFKTKLKDLKDTKPIFSCNCILNYLYGGLEGKCTEPFEGPVTFGEVAFQLLNQTLVYIVEA